MNGYTPAFDKADQFLRMQGRMKYLNPIYLAYMRYGYRERAFNNYLATKDFYHPIAAANIRKLLL